MSTKFKNLEKQRAAIRMAIAICGTQERLATRLCEATGKDVRQYNVADWLRRGMPWWWAGPISKVCGVDEQLLHPPPRKKKRSANEKSN